MDKSGADSDWQTPEQRKAQIKQAQALYEQASRRGLRLEAYLLPRIAEKVLDDVTKQKFRDPSEFVSHAVQQFWELDKHPDLQKELLKRQIQEGIDSGPGIPMEEVRLHLTKLAEECANEKPAVWQSVFSDEK